MVAGVLALCLHGTAVAGPHEDANAADARGDYAAELAILRPNAEQGLAWAQNNLGNLYAAGYGVPRDYGKAVFWYRKAAEQGDKVAGGLLAKMYDEGQGVPKDPAQAFYWYRKVAEKGDTDAQAKVGSAYALGKGVAQDYVQAYVWLDVAVAEAAAGGGADDTALARDSVASHLTPAQLADAKQQAAALKAKLDAQ